MEREPSETPGSNTRPSLKQSLREIPGKLPEIYRTYHTLIYLSLISLIAELSYAIVNQSALPPYLAVINLKAHAGTVMSTFLVIEAVLKSPMGSLGDRIGRRPLIVGSALVSSVTAILVTRATTLPTLLALRVFDGIAAAAIWPTLIAAVSGSVPKERRTLSMSAMTVTYMVGVALGPFIGGLANDLTNSKLTSFYLVSGLFVLTAVVAFFLTPHRTAEELQSADEDGEQAFHLSDLLIGVRKVPDMMILAFMAFLAVGLLMPVVKYFAMDEFGMSETSFGKLVLPIAGAVALASIAAGHMGDRWGKARSVRLGVTLAALSMWWIASSRQVWEVAVAGMVLGVGFVIAMPSWLSLVSDMAAPRCRGTVIGALGGSQGLGAVVGAVFSSRLYSYGSSTSVSVFGHSLNTHYLPFYASALALTFCVLLVFVSVKDNDTRRIGFGNGESS